MFKRKQTRKYNKEKKKQGNVAETINCANSKDNHGLKFIKNECATNIHPSLFDSFVIKQEHKVF